MQYGKSRPSSQPINVDAEDSESDDHEVSEPEYNFPPFPARQSTLRTLLPGEAIDFSTIQTAFDKLLDQCQRLMGTLEATRLELDTVKEERDRYMQYCNLSFNYHNAMNSISRDLSFRSPVTQGLPFNGGLPLPLSLFQAYYLLTSR